MENFVYPDDQYPFSGFDHLRLVARAIVVDEEGRVALHRIRRDDMFCNQEYFETPGGGVDEGETLEKALVRECEEELGLIVEPLEEIAVVKDAYNLIKRQNENHYFLAKAARKTKKHFESEGDAYIVETLWVSIEEAIELMEKMDKTLVSGLVRQRELPVLRLAKGRIEHISLAS